MLQSVYGNMAEILHQFNIHHDEFHGKAFINTFIKPVEKVRKMLTISSIHSMESLTQLQHVPKLVVYRKK